MARKTINELKPSMEGKKITCIISNEKIDDGIIAYEDGKYYICQDEVSGTSPKDKYGYRYGWSLLKGNKSNMESSLVENLQFQDESNDFLIDDEQKLRHDDNRHGDDYTLATDGVRVAGLEGMSEFLKEALLNALKGSTGHSISMGGGIRATIESSRRMNKKEVTTITKEGDTESIIIPRNMSKLEASIQLEKQHQEEETVIELYQGFFKWDIEDALVAIMRTLKKTFGWVAGQPTPGFFGPTPPAEFNVVTDIVDGKEKHESCFYGQFGVAQWDAGKGQTGVSSEGTFIKFTIKKKFTERAKSFFAAVDAELKTNSIFKGKSLVMTSEYNAMIADRRPKLNFCENKGSNNIILNEAEERVVVNLVINPLGREGKRCVLFTGPYGTLKSVA